MPTTIQSRIMPTTLTNVCSGLLLPTKYKTASADPPPLPLARSTAFSREDVRKRVQNAVRRGFGANANASATLSLCLLDLSRTKICSDQDAQSAIFIVRETLLALPVTEVIIKGVSVAHNRLSSEALEVFMDWIGGRLVAPPLDEHRTGDLFVPHASPVAPRIRVEVETLILFDVGPMSDACVEQLRMLVDSKCPLRNLKIGDNEALTINQARILFSPWPQSLQSLHIGGCRQLGDEFAALLAANVEAPREIKGFFGRSLGLTAIGMIHLHKFLLNSHFRLPLVPKTPTSLQRCGLLAQNTLRELQLRENPLRNVGLLVLGEILRSTPALEVLDIEAVASDDRGGGVAPLLRALRETHSRVRELNLSRNKLSAVDVEQLRLWLVCPRSCLHILSIAHCGLDGYLAEMLFDGVAGNALRQSRESGFSSRLFYPSVAHLTLSGNPIGSGGAAYCDVSPGIHSLAVVLASRCRLHEVRMNNCQLNTAEMTVLFKALQPVARFDPDTHPIFGTVDTEKCSGLRQCPLRVLHVAQNCCNDPTTIDMLCEMIRTNVNLVSLEFHDNSIGTLSWMFAIVDALEASSAHFSSFCFGGQSPEANVTTAHICHRVSTHLKRTKDRPQ